MSDQCDMDFPSEEVPRADSQDLGFFEGRRRRLDRCGYVRLGKSDYEHRVVASRMLGRPLTADDHVSHRNGNRLDNQPDNLEVLSRSDRVARDNRRTPKRRKGIRSSLEQVNMEIEAARKAEAARTRAEEFVASLRELGDS